VPGMQPRQIFKGATYLVTRRCTQRQFLLAPKRRTNQTFHYCLAYAARQTGVWVHAVIVMSNHYHLLVTDPKGVLPEFVACLNKLVAKCMNASYGRWENFWASQQASYVRLLDSEAIVDLMSYVLCNPVEAGLVKRGVEWPGLRFGHRGSFPVRRPQFFRENGHMPKTLVLELDWPPLGEGVSSQEARRRIDEAVETREREAQEKMRREGRTFLGPRSVIAQDPFASPETCEPRRRLSPRVAGRNRWLRMETLARCAEFLKAYRDALFAWRENRRDVVFPAGTYLMRWQHQACCADA
jgi:putative transposase